MVHAKTSRVFAALFTVFDCTLQRLNWGGTWGAIAVVPQSIERLTKGG